MHLANKCNIMVSNEMKVVVSNVHKAVAKVTTMQSYAAYVFECGQEQAHNYSTMCNFNYYFIT